MITVFTPTYNRAYILPKLYESLCRQTSKAFEWIVVDDGSTDKTTELVKAWEQEDKVKIKYIKQENQGKHIAINTGVNHSSGELFFIVDSDDFLKDDAIEKISTFWKESDPDTNISGIIGYREFFDGRLVGKPLPSDVKRCKFRETWSKYGSSGDKVVIYKTNVLKKYSFPKFGNEKFLGEGFVFNQIDDEYDMLIMTDRIYCFGYQEDGLSQDFRKLYRNNPIGFLMWYEQQLTYSNTIKSKIKTTAHILNLGLKTKYFTKFFRHFFTPRGLVAFIPSLYLYNKIFIKKISDVKPFTVSAE